MILTLLANYIAAHPRAEAALNTVVRWVIASQPYLPGLGWFLAVFYGLWALLCALGAWWPGAAACTGGGVLSVLCVRLMQYGARELERLTAEHERTAGGGDAA